MEADAIHPMLGIVKELNLQFVLGYTQDEFAATLGHIAEGRIPTTPLITGRVGIDGVAQAFEALASPERHAKILVQTGDRKSTRLNSSHSQISYAVFCLKKKKTKYQHSTTISCEFNI